MATIKKNITVDQDVYNRFIAIAEENGIKFSTWINLQLKKCRETRIYHRRLRHFKSVFFINKNKYNY